MPGDVAAEPKAHSAPEIARQSLPTKFRFPDKRWRGRSRGVTVAKLSAEEQRSQVA